MSAGTLPRSSAGGPLASLYPLDCCSPIMPVNLVYLFQRVKHRDRTILGNPGQGDFAIGEHTAFCHYPCARDARDILTTDQIKLFHAAPFLTAKEKQLGGQNGFGSEE